MKKSIKYMTYMIFIIFGIIVSYLFLLSIFSTSYISTCPFPDKEFTYYCPDNPWMHIIILSIFSLIGILIFHFSHYTRRIVLILEKFAKYIPFVVFICGVLWIYTIKLVPIADQLAVVNAAAYFKHGDFSFMEKGSYLDIYPHQLGLVLIIYYFSLIFGENNYMFFQLINVISLAVIVFLSSKLAFEITKSKAISAIITYFSALFFPLFLYSVFIYGTMPGLALTFLSFYLLLRYINGDSVIKLVIAVFCIVIAVFIKQNYLIGLIAFSIILVFYSIKEKHFPSLLLLLLIIPIYLSGTVFINSEIKRITGITPGSGYPKSSWIYMGMKENATKASGWFYDYTSEIYSTYDMDTDKTNSAIIYDIKIRLKDFINDPLYAIKFFSKKTASQWNNPTFQCFWIYLSSYSLDARNLHQTDFTDKIIGISEDSTVNKNIINVFNTFQSFILFGAVLYCVYYIKRSAQETDIKTLLLPLFFIGGFLFHLMWEAKSLYTLPYFVTLIPLAIIGFKDFIIDLYVSTFVNKRMLSKPIIILIILVVLVLLISVLPWNINNDIFKIVEYSEQYSTDTWN